MSVIHFLVATVMIPAILGGFGPPPSREELYKQLAGIPCECKGGFVSGPVPLMNLNQGGPKNPHSGGRIISVDCHDKTAYLSADSSPGGLSSGLGYGRLSWKCAKKPKIIPPVNGKPGPCPNPCKKVTALHSTCYASVQQCTDTEGKISLTATLLKTYSGSSGGDWDDSTLRGGRNSKYAQASCVGSIGQFMCWPPQAPLHISDGGRPTDKVSPSQRKN